MDENKIKELYEAEINNSAPDYDKLWEIIEECLPPSPPKIKVTARKSAVKTIAVVAAGILLVAFVPSLFSSGRIAMNSQTAPSQDSLQNSAGEQGDSESPTDYEIMDSTADDFVPPWQPKSYEELKFDSYSETIYTPKGEPYGADYFVEEEILAETDCLAVAVVKDICMSDDGCSITYILEPQCAYGSYSEAAGDISVKSCSVYTMKRGRKYLLPLVKTADGYRTAYDNVPQIEFTADGALVYYNGWSSLDSEYSNSISYPQKTVDDFFYDRMMLSGGGYSELIEKFYEIKKL